MRRIEQEINHEQSEEEQKNRCRKHHEFNIGDEEDMCEGTKQKSIYQRERPAVVPERKSEKCTGKELHSRVQHGNPTPAPVTPAPKKHPGEDRYEFIPL